MSASTSGALDACSAGASSTLIVAEVALSVVLLVGSGLLLVSFVRLQRTPPGFEAKGAAAAFVGVPAVRYKTRSSPRSRPTSRRASAPSASIVGLEERRLPGGV